MNIVIDLEDECIKKIEKVRFLIGFNMAVALCNKRIGKEIKNDTDRG